MQNLPAGSGRDCAAILSDREANLGELQDYIFEYYVETKIGPLQKAHKLIKSLITPQSHFKEIASSGIFRVDRENYYKVILSHVTHIYAPNGKQIAVFTESQKCMLVGGINVIMKYHSGVELKKNFEEYYEMVWKATDLPIKVVE